MARVKGAVNAKKNHRKIGEKTKEATASFFVSFSSIFFHDIITHVIIVLGRGINVRSW